MHPLSEGSRPWQATTESMFLNARILSNDAKNHRTMESSRLERIKFNHQPDLPSPKPCPLVPQEDAEEYVRTVHSFLPSFGLFKNLMAPPQIFL